MPQPTSNNTAHNASMQAWNSINSGMSSLGTPMGNNTFFGGPLNGSVITASGSPTISQQAQSVIGQYFGNPSTIINNNTVYGNTPSLDDYNGIKWGDLSAIQQRRMLRMAQREQNNSNNDSKNNREDGENGGNPGRDFSGLAGAFGQAAQIGTTLFGNQYSDEGMSDEQAAAKFASNFGPYGAMAAGIASVSSQVSRALGVNTSKMSKQAADAAGVKGGARLANNVASLINNTTFGLWGGFGALGKTNDYNMSQEAEQLSGAYAGTTSDMRAAEDAAGKSFFFGRGKLNNLVNTSIQNDQLLSQIGIDNNQRVSSVPYNADLIAARNFNKLNGATYQGYGTRIGKQGMKMLSREELDKIYAAKKIIEESDIQKFQNGGSILIPNGALHAHKHHMEDINPELAEDLTKKGIPIVSTDENGEVTQVAEIERQEMILEKSLTDEIEKLWKDGSEEAMIKAGKLITETLFTNCDDNANLVKEVE